MQKMTRSPATPGPTGLQSCRSPALVMCARPRNRGTAAVTAERVGPRMSKKFSTGYIRMILNKKHGGARSRPKIIDKIHDQWCRDNGYPVHKPTSLQAQRRKTTSHKLRAQASSPSLQAPRS